MGRNKKIELREIKNESLNQVRPLLKKELDETERKIQEGLSKKTASTGANIDDLHGGAKFMSQLSNIGGGSKATGGGGVEDGFNTVNKNTAIKARLEFLEKSEKKKRKALIDVDGNN